MAGSAVYLDIAKVNLSSGTYDESKSFANQGVVNTAAFKLRGGKYGITAMGTTFSAQLQKLAGDASTWVPVGSAIVANGYTTQDLTEGDYRWAIS